MRFAVFALSATLIATASQPIASAQQAAPTVEPRAVAASVAQLVDDNYFDPAKAHHVAQQLRTRAQQGVYDRFTNPLDLAGALTTFLHPFDGHFTVIYQPNAGAPVGPGPQAGPRPGSGSPSTGLVARQNYGFRRVEM